MSFTINDDVTLTSSASIDNVRISGNTISSTDTNGNVVLAPDGVGIVDVTANMRHTGLTLNEGTTPNVDEIKTFTKALSISTSWIDTGIVGSDLSDGSYIVQVYDDINTGVAHYEMTFTGIMSWFSSSSTNDTAYNEILLHNAGQTINSNPIFLRTMMQTSPGYLKLQIRCATGSGSGDFIFKFRRMI